MNIENTVLELNQDRAIEILLKLENGENATVTIFTKNIDFHPQNLFNGLEKRITKELNQTLEITGKVITNTKGTLEFARLESELKCDLKSN
jgi:hypothetical protein